MAGDRTGGSFQTRLISDVALPDGAERALAARIDRQGISDASLTVKGGRREVVVRLPDTPAGHAALRDMRTIGLLELRPVLEMLAPGSVPVTPPDELRPEAEVVLSGAGLDADALYRLGPSRLPEGAVQAAKAQPGTGRNWTILVELSEAGSVAFNELAAEHLQRQVAILVDGQILTAPVIHSPDFGREVVITGSFTEAEAEAMAEALTSGPVRLRQASA